MFEGHELNPAQNEVARHGILSSGFNCVLQLPTGSGKTWLAERAIEATLKAGQRAIYLTPLRALATELLAKWSATFTSFKVGVFTGEYGKKLAFPVPFEDAQLLIMTPERLDACTRNWRQHWAWIPDIDLVVLDELHLIGEAQRGPRLEGALLRLMRLNPFARILGLSATLGNRSELADWLEGVDLESQWRPVPLNWRVRKFRKATEKPQILLEEVQQCVADGGQSLVFVQSRRRAEQLAAHLSSNGLIAKHHHAGLTKEDRNTTETLYREKQIQALISTGTLEMGLNLPARQVVLFDLQHFNGREFVPLSTNTVWQRAGRAGRPGFDEEGEVVLIAAGWEKQPRGYLLGQFDPIRSMLTDEWTLAEQVIAEVGSGLSRNLNQLKRSFSRSLAHHQGQTIDVSETVERMLKAGMLKEIQNERSQALLLKPTRLGRIAVRQMLSPTTILHLARCLQGDDAERLTLFDQILICTTTWDCSPRIPVDFEELESLQDRLEQEASWLLGRGLKFAGSYLDVSGKLLLTCLKTALVARSWTRTGDEAAVAEQFGCYPFEVHRLAESLERMLTAASAIVRPKKDAADEENVDSSASDDDDPQTSEKLSALVSMIAYGIDEEAVSLTFVPGIGGTLARRLLAAGIFDIEDLAQASPDVVGQVRGISISRAKRFVDNASDLLGERSSFTFRELGPKLRSALQSWPGDIDPYRLRRALDLAVVDGEGHVYSVSGGLEPHRVQFPAASPAHCDCADFDNGNLCKHILAVRLQRQDAELAELSKRLKKCAPEVDVFQLWLGGNRT